MNDLTPMEDLSPFSNEGAHKEDFSPVKKDRMEEQGLDLKRAFKDIEGQSKSPDVKIKAKKIKGGAEYYKEIFSKQFDYNEVKDKVFKVINQFEKRQDDKLKSHLLDLHATAKLSQIKPAEEASNKSDAPKTPEDFKDIFKKMMLGQLKEQDLQATKNDEFIPQKAALPPQAPTEKKAFEKFEGTYTDKEMYDRIVDLLVSRFIKESGLNEEENQNIIPALRSIAFLIAIKQSVDFRVFNSDFIVAFNIDGKELNLMERTFLKVIKFDLSIPKEFQQQGQ